MGRLRIDRICRETGSLRDGSGRTVVGRLYLATSRRSRLVGLLGTTDLGSGEGVWLEPCSSVHTFGMRMPIACAFLDADGRVLRVIDPLPAWRSASARGARAVVEAAPGTFAGRAAGTVLVRA